MSAKLPANTNLDSALAQKGFVFVSPQQGNWRYYEGSLRTGDAVHSCIMRVDVDGLELPEIKIDAIPPGLPAAVPHLGANGLLCYAARGSIVLDVFDLNRQVVSCIERAESVLSKILAGEMVDDLEDEFFAYWPGYLAFSDVQPKANQPLKVALFTKQDEGMIVLSHDVALSATKMASIGFTQDPTQQLDVVRIRTKAAPRPLQGDWPPKTVKDFLTWQGQLDHQSRKKLNDLILESRKQGNLNLLCVIESPRMTYGARIDFSDEKGTLPKSAGAGQPVGTYEAPITPVLFIPINDEYIATRNTPNKATLIKKKIALVGCGTIGGYLADMLLKAGAGINNGELCLIDNDVFQPQNIGRHKLGFNSIRQNKAEALAAELKRLAPLADVQGLDKSALDVDLSAFDLVINATGEEALGHLLSKKYSGPAFVPMLSIWIEGPGSAIRGLMRDYPNAACTRCLLAENRTPLYPVVNGAPPEEFAGQGCENFYVPFPMTVSVQAACLAHEMTLAWAGKALHHKLITRVLDHSLVAGTPDTTPPQRPECPACSS